MTSLRLSERSLLWERQLTGVLLHLKLFTCCLSYPSGLWRGGGKGGEKRGEMDLSLPSTAQETVSKTFTNLPKLTVSHQLCRDSNLELCVLGRAPDSGVANDPLPTGGLPLGALFWAALSPLALLWERKAPPPLSPAQHLWVPLAVRAHQAGAAPVGEEEVPGRSGEGWWKLPEAAGTGLGVGRRDTGVGSRLFPTLPQGSLYITRPA